MLNDEKKGVLVTLKGNGKTFENIKGELLFPADYEGPVHIELTIPPQQLDVIMELQDADVISVKAVCSGVTYISQNAYMGKSTISDSIYTENKATISAYDVKKTVSLPGKGKNHFNITFWLNNDAELPYGNYIEKHFDGSVKAKKCNENISVYTLSDKFTLKFKHIYQYKNNGGGYTAYRHNACEVIIDKRITDETIIKKIITKLEDFLLLVSFGYDNRISWIGYEYLDKNNYYEFYRGKFKSSRVKNRPFELSQNGFFIKDFVLAAYTKLTNNRIRYEAIKRAIYALCNNQDMGIIDSKFLELFSAFEAILLSYNRNSHSEQLLSSNKFKNLGKAIEKTISDYFVLNSLDFSVKEQVIEKISELNRPSLQNTLQRFQKEYDLPLELFWPFFAKTKPGLSDIRNKMIHGDYLYGKYDYLDFARHQLRVILIITIVKVLDWPLDKTRYTEDSIKRLCSYYPNILKTAQDNWKHNKIKENTDIAKIK